MNRRSFLQVATLLSAQGALVPAEPTTHGVKADSESQRRITRATAAAMSMQRRDWEQGILAQAMFEVGDRKRLIQLTRAAMVQAAPDGRLGVVVSGGPTDPAMGGAAYAQAAEWNSDPQIRQAVDKLFLWIRHKAPRSADGILYHVFDAPQMWSDGFNGAPPFLATLGDYDEALKQIDGFRSRLWNPDKQLLAHIWDDGKRQLKDPGFWGGGNGWAAAGLARVIRSLPRERLTDRQRLAEFLRQIVDGCLKHQHSDGLFHNVIDERDSFVETNLAQMLAYSIYTGIAGRWLPAHYRVHADVMRAAARAKMDPDGFVQGVCGAPDFERPGISTEGQAFCILMESAGESVAD
jgi:rhamnogalacturonyl hydrolase YesR